MGNPAADPLFQLNTVLWMLQPLPDERRRNSTGSSSKVHAHDASSSHSDGSWSRYSRRRSVRPAPSLQVSVIAVNPVPPDYAGR
jgi:hypothetical protein